MLFNAANKTKSIKNSCLESTPRYKYNYKLKIVVSSNFLVYLFPKNKNEK